MSAGKFGLPDWSRLNVKRGTLNLATARAAPAEIRLGRGGESGGLNRGGDCCRSEGSDRWEYEECDHCGGRETQRASDVSRGRAGDDVYAGNGATWQHNGGERDGEYDFTLNEGGGTSKGERATTLREWRDRRRGRAGTKTGRRDA